MRLDLISFSQANGDWRSLQVSQVEMFVQYPFDCCTELHFRGCCHVFLLSEYVSVHVLLIEQSLVFQRKLFEELGDVRLVSCCCGCSLTRLV